MSEHEQHDQESGESSTSGVLRDEDQFIEQRSQKRFIFDAYFNAPFPEIDWPGLDGKNEDTSVSLTSRQERWHRTVEEAWRRLHQTRKSDGYGALYDLKTRLEAHWEKEEEKLQTANTKIDAVGWYQDVLERKGGGTGCTKPMIEAFPPSSHGDPSSQGEELSGPVEPRCHLKWQENPGKWQENPKAWLEGTGVQAEYFGEIRLRQALGDPGVSYPLKFSSNDTVKEVWDKLRDMKTESTEVRQRRFTICRLIDLRQTLLKRFLWTYEIAGKVPKTVSVSHISEKLTNNPKALRYARIVLEVRPHLLNARPHVGNPPARKELKDCIRERVDFADLGCNQSQAVVNGAVRLLKEVLNDIGNQSIDAEFWRLLDRHEDLLKKSVEEMDLEIPEPPGGERSSSSKPQRDS